MSQPPLYIKGMVHTKYAVMDFSFKQSLFHEDPSLMIVSALIFAAHEAIPGRVNLLGNLCEG
jgi:hypothetical protein